MGIITLYKALIKAGLPQDQAEEVIDSFGFVGKGAMRLDPDGLKRLITVIEEQTAKNNAKSLS